MCEENYDQSTTHAYNNNGNFDIIFLLLLMFILLWNTPHIADSSSRYVKNKAHDILGIFNKNFEDGDVGTVATEHRELSEGGQSNGVSYVSGYDFFLGP